MVIMNNEIGLHFFLTSKHSLELREYLKSQSNQRRQTAQSGQTPNRCVSPVTHRLSEIKPSIAFASLKVIL